MFSKEFPLMIRENWKTMSKIEQTIDKSRNKGYLFIYTHKKSKLINRT